jgi:hypothetical protein
MNRAIPHRRPKEGRYYLRVALLFCAGEESKTMLDLLEKAAQEFAENARKSLQR